MTETIEPLDLRGNDLLRWVINRIISNPQMWKQSSWHCGTSHCFLGWADFAVHGAEKVAQVQRECSPENLTGRLTAPIDSIGDLMGLSKRQTEWAMVGNRKLHHLYVFCREHLAGRPTVQRMSETIRTPAGRTTTRKWDGLAPEFTAVLQEADRLNAQGVFRYDPL